LALKMVFCLGGSVVEKGCADDAGKDTTPQSRRALMCVGSSLRALMMRMPSGTDTLRPTKPAPPTCMRSVPRASSSDLISTMHA
jgi:hypothetical protein